MAWTRYSRASIDPQSPRALGMCERCGFIWNQHRLSDQHDWRGPRLQNLNIFVCPDCIDEPQQNGQRAFRLPPDPVPIINPSIDPNMIGGEGPQYGPELVTNGNFYSSAGWALQNGALIYDGTLRFPRSNARAVRTAADTIVSGTYAAQFDVLYGAGSGIVLRLEVGSSTLLITLDDGLVTYSMDIVSAAASQLVGLTATTVAYVIVDNFSVRRRL